MGRCLVKAPDWSCDDTSAYFQLSRRRCTRGKSINSGFGSVRLATGKSGIAGSDPRISIPKATIFKLFGQWPAEPSKSFDVWFEVDGASKTKMRDLRFFVAKSSDGPKIEVKAAEDAGKAVWRRIIALRKMLRLKEGKPWSDGLSDTDLDQVGQSAASDVENEDSSHSSSREENHTWTSRRGVLEDGEEEQSSPRPSSSRRGVSQDSEEEMEDAVVNSEDEAEIDNMDSGSEESEAVFTDGGD